MPFSLDTGGFQSVILNEKLFSVEHCALLPISNKENSHVMLVLNKNLHAMVKTEVLTLARSVNLLFPSITNATKETSKNPTGQTLSGNKIFIDFVHLLDQHIKRTHIISLTFV